MYNPYLNQFPYYQPQQNILPPQQILQANGMASINGIKMSPDSSVLIADSNEPIIYKCVSDGLGNVTTTAWDITPHKDKEVQEKENLTVIVADMNERVKRLEESYESLTKWREKSNDESDKANRENAKERKQPTSYDKSANGK